MSEPAHNDQMHVRVSFPITKKGPYEAEDPAETTVGTVLAAAMNHFEVHDDSQFTYVLAHDGQEEKDSTTIGSIAGTAREVRFTLVKKLTQG
jgi:hypothetical protein